VSKLAFFIGAAIFFIAAILVFFDGNWQTGAFLIALAIVIFFFTWKS
jgi:hypothetical protein